MLKADQITPYLPHLRRYARALTGSQHSGDAYVINTLEAMVADPPAIEPHQIRVSLYRTFNSIWNSIAVNLQTEHDDSATKNLAAITPLARQAFLLKAVEGFNLEESAGILGVSREQFSTLLSQASKEISEQVATSVMIIEDEPLIAMEVEQLVEDLGHRVTGICRTQTEALEHIATIRPGLILADIHLADGSSGIDAVNEILTSINVPVIFITAYPERLLTGKRPEPAFLVTKPFHPDMVKALISQALFFEQKAGELV